MKKPAMVWLDYASRDLEAATLLVVNEFVANVVLFHSQQCIEKCLKALLEKEGKPAPRIHSITKLHELLDEVGKSSLSLKDDELDLVDAVYIDSRYPTGIGLLPSGFPTKEDAQELLDIAKMVYQETSGLLKE